MSRLATQPVPDLSLVPGEIQTTLDRLSRELEELRQRDELLVTSFQRLEEQLLLASQVQRDLLPNPLPRIDGLKLHTLYLPADHVSGDIYDVRRVDETHAAISIADAAGHGMPAALLTVFIKRGFRAKEITNGCYRIVPPAEVLERLNGDLLETALPDGRFVTAIHALYEQETRTLAWARAGAPYPILVRDGRPTPLCSRGTLLGVIEEVGFETVELALRPGDVVLFHTDGLDALLCHPSQRQPVHLHETAWYQDLGRVPFANQCARIAERRAAQHPGDKFLDDISLVALEIQN